jgi:hypothetical protein
LFIQIGGQKDYEQREKEERNRGIYKENKKGLGIREREY